MFDNLKKILYFKKIQLLFDKGLKNGSIIPFEEDFYKKMSQTYISCLPVSIHIKYLKPLIPPGKCYDRSLYMFMCFKEAILVRGDNKDLEFRYGKDYAGHGWIEMDDYCYDPSTLLRYKKDVFYEIYKPYNICKITALEYKNCSSPNKQFYEDVINTTIDDFKPNGRKRTDLCAVIPIVQSIAKTKGFQDFEKELNNYLNLIEYDEVEIIEEMNKLLKKIKIH